MTCHAIQTDRELRGRIADASLQGNHPVRILQQSPTADLGSSVFKALPTQTRPATHKSQTGKPRNHPRPELTVTMRHCLGIRFANSKEAVTMMRITSRTHSFPAHPPRRRHPPPRPATACTPRSTWTNADAPAALPPHRRRHPVELAPGQTITNLRQRGSRWRYSATPDADHGTVTASRERLSTCSGRRTRRSSIMQA